MTFLNTTCFFVKICSDHNFMKSNLIIHVLIGKETMDSFKINQKFDDFNSVLIAKKAYETASNTILVIDSSHILKGEGDFVASKVYDRVSFACKAGKERPCKSKGIRPSSTYKSNCPFKVSLFLIDGKFSVQNMIPNHENNQTDKNTFLSYSENVRLTENECVQVKQLIECGANKQRIKAVLSKDRDAPLPLKVLHNLDTKMRLGKQTNNRKDDFKHLIEMMISIPDARVRIIKNEENELVGIYYQDSRMAHIFDKYPEIIFFDATHKPNKLDMPLFIQLCVDGNEDSEIISLYICMSESREGIGSMIDAFKELNPSWNKTKVKFGDKDFADRMVYTEKFLNAVLMICIFHVLRTFRREITTHKRGITNTQRDQALRILQRLVYSTSETEYNSTYDELINLNLEHVTSYYNDNWHTIRSEWSLFGTNEHCTYLNTTNNRLESLNGKIKSVGNRHANLQSFLENLSISVSNISSEKDLAAVRTTMRRSRQCFNDPVLTSYRTFLTEFSFEKIEKQYELAERVEFISIDDATAIVGNDRNDKVSLTSCSCLYFSSMDLPCRHILKFLLVKDLDPFAPQLCAVRWTKQYLNASHPALLSQEQINKTTPVFVKVCDPNELDRYKKVVAIAKEVRNTAAELSPADQSLFVTKLKIWTDDFVNSSREGITISEEGENSTIVQDDQIPMDLSINKPLGPTTVDNSQHQHDDTKNYEAPAECLSHRTVIDKPSLFRQGQPLAILSSIENIKIPDNKKSVGRPKGTKLTAIGIKSKCGSNVSKTSKKIAEDANYQRFVAKSKEDQALTIIQWLTNYSKVPKKILSSTDIVTDINILTRLRNEEVSLDCLKGFVDKNCFEFIKNEISLLNEKPWNCSKCHLILDRLQVRCDYCLDWFHFECVRSGNTDAFICCSCN